MLHSQGPPCQRVWRGDCLGPILDKYRAVCAASCKGMCVWLFAPTVDIHRQLAFTRLCAGTLARIETRTHTLHVQAADRIERDAL
jgi:hypothetical protein